MGGEDWRRNTRGDNESGLPQLNSFCAAIGDRRLPRSSLRSRSGAKKRQLTVKVAQGPFSGFSSVTHCEEWNLRVQGLEVQDDLEPRGSAGC